jgi:hypothetical protein
MTLAFDLEIGHNWFSMVDYDYVGAHVKYRPNDQDIGA